MTSKHGISVKLPLTYNSSDGPYSLNKTTKEAVRQNFKNLILTAPGERVMDPQFGVGLRNYLFEQINDVLYSKIATRIREQVRSYIPFIFIEHISFESMDTNSAMGPNEVQVFIKYNILPLDAEDTLSITAATN
jgi:phage baseplate assembly protein W|tara:strand:+ start:95 stop:496 length:402 start_codon:yes stop_codon:yes gene_type:complete